LIFDIKDELAGGETVESRWMCISNLSATE
jgi:hypothetical protein